MNIESMFNFEVLLLVIQIDYLLFQFLFLSNLLLNCRLLIRCYNLLILDHHLFNNWVVTTINLLDKLNFWRAWNYLNGLLWTTSINTTWSLRLLSLGISLDFFKVFLLFEIWIDTISTEYKLLIIAM